MIQATMHTNKAFFEEPDVAYWIQHAVNEGGNELQPPEGNNTKDLSRQHTDAHIVTIKL